MSVLRYAMPIAALVLVVGACSSTPVATSGPATAVPGSTSAAPTAAGPTTAAPTGAAPTVAAASPAALGGTWTFVLSNPRVLAATGNAVGGTIVIDGTKSVFSAGSYRSEDPIEITGNRALDCTATSCDIEGVPLHHVRLVDGELAIVHKAMLTSLGAFGGTCPWEDVPDGGVITVVSTGMVDGQDVPTVVTFTDGAASGTGADCEMGSYSVAWDVTATRQ